MADPATPKETTAAIRAALKEAFPGEVFSVRMGRGVNDGSTEVTWTDGPTYDQVEAVVAPFVSHRFDRQAGCLVPTGNDQWDCFDPCLHRITSGDYAPRLLRGIGEIIAPAEEP